MSRAPLPHVHDFCAPPGETDITTLNARMNLRRLRGQPFLTARETLMLLDWPSLDGQVGVERPLRDALNQARIKLIRQREWLPARPDLNAVTLPSLHPRLLRDHPLTTAAEFTAVGQIALLAAVAAEVRRRALRGEAVSPHLHPLHHFTGLLTLPDPETAEPTRLARRRWTWTQPPPAPMNPEFSRHRPAFLASAGPAWQTSGAAARSRPPLPPKPWWLKLGPTPPGQGASGLQAGPATVILGGPSQPVGSWARRMPAENDLTEEELRALLREAGLHDEVTGLVAGLMVAHICVSALKRPPATERDWADQAVLRAGLPTSDAALSTDLYLPWPRPGTEAPALWSARPPAPWSGRPLRWNGLLRAISDLDTQLARTPVLRAADGTLDASGLLRALLPLRRAQTQALLWLRDQAMPGDTAQLLQGLLTALESAPPPPLRWRPRAAQLRGDLQHALGHALSRGRA